MQKEPYNNTYCHTVNVVIHRNSLHMQDTNNHTPESVSYFPHRNSLHTDRHRLRQHRHRGLNLSSILKFSPGQPCQGVSHHMCVCVKFTLTLISGHNTTYVWYCSRRGDISLTEGILIVDPWGLRAAGRY